MQYDLGKVKMRFRGTFSTSTVYSENDIVYYLGSSYIYISATPSTTAAPAETTEHRWSKCCNGVVVMTADELNTHGSDYADNQVILVICP